VGRVRATQCELVVLLDDHPNAATFSSTAARVVGHVHLRNSTEHTVAALHDALNAITRFMPTVTGITVRGVLSLDAVTTLPPVLRTFSHTQDAAPGESMTMLTPLTRLNHLVHISLDDAIDEAHARVLRSIASLRSVVVNGVRRAALDVLFDQPPLPWTTVGLTMQDDMARVLRQMATVLPELNCLAVWTTGTSTPDALLKTLAFPRVERVRLGGSVPASATDILFPACPLLTDLNLIATRAGSAEFTAEMCAAWLNECPPLTALTLNNIKGIKRFGPLLSRGDRLRALTIVDCETNGPVDDAVAMTQLPQLTSLQLQLSNVFDTTHDVFRLLLSQSLRAKLMPALKHVAFRRGNVY
jgi:hypothetical protein